MVALFVFTVVLLYLARTKSSTLLNRNENSNIFLKSFDCFVIVMYKNKFIYVIVETTLNTYLELLVLKHGKLFLLPYLLLTAT